MKSRTESRTARADFQNNFVLARAFGDEPIKLAAKGDFGGVVELDVEGTTVLFPKDDVFQFDEGLFRRLRRAFAAGDKPLLSQLWDQAGRADAPALA
jgi:hypothetical protein